MLDLNLAPVPRADMEGRFGIPGEKLTDRETLDYQDEYDDYSYTYRTFSENGGSGNGFEIVREKINTLITLFLDRAEDDGQPDFPLLGIGVAVAGPVDYAKKIWCSAPRITSTKNVTLQDLIGYRNYERTQKLGIFLSLDNNAKSSVVSEYQYLLEQSAGRYMQDVALIYIGSGIGLAAVIGRKLLKGSRNLSGELGHVHLLLDGKNDSHEVRSVEDCIMGGTEMREDGGTGMYERYVTYLPHVLNMVNCILGIDRFILVGHSLAKHKNLSAALMEDRFKFTVESTQQYCERETGGRNTPSTAAIGAAIESYFCMCAYSGGDDRANLAHDISWNEVKD